MSRPHVRRGVAPEERQDGDALLQTDGNVVLDGEVQDQVHAERPVGQRPDPADFLTEERRGAQLGLQDAEAAGVAHRRDEVRAGQVRSHRRGDDGVLDPQHVTEIRFHEHLKVTVVNRSEPATTPDRGAPCCPPVAAAAAAHRNATGASVASGATLGGPRPHPCRRTTANHAFGPPWENLTSVNSAFTSTWTGWTDSTSQPSANASYNSCRDTRRGPSVPGSSSLKHSRNSRPPGSTTSASPRT